ncbi:MAG TPA: hypothetical protein VM934_15045 [Pyrinomonadaceae bacterium]|jgi:hypothetical protein|nr:hypothetical protein [Pyrinomonadaceae bacterium]
MRRAATIIAYAGAGAFAAALAGYLVGAVAGVVMTWQNNRMPGAPYGSYVWWANFVGMLIAMFTWPFGILFGLVFALARKTNRLR